MDGNGYFTANIIKNVAPGLMGNTWLLLLLLHSWADSSLTFDAQLDDVLERSRLGNFLDDMTPWHLQLAYELVIFK